jgi:hypothetical protein
MNGPIAIVLVIYTLGLIALFIYGTHQQAQLIRELTVTTSRTVDAIALSHTEVVGLAKHLGDQAYLERREQRGQEHEARETSAARAHAETMAKMATPPVAPLEERAEALMREFYGGVAAGDVPPGDPSPGLDDLAQWDLRGGAGLEPWDSMATGIAEHDTGARESVAVVPPGGSLIPTDE